MAENGISEGFIDGEVRVAVLRKNGEIEEGHAFSAEKYAGSIPAAGDYLAALWPDDDHEIFQVIERIHVMEFDVGTYWLLIVKQIDYAPHLDAPLAHSRKYSGMLRAIIKEHEDEVWASLTKRMKKPKSSKQRGTKKKPS